MKVSGRSLATSKGAPPGRAMEMVAFTAVMKRPRSKRRRTKRSDTVARG
jgi:hypothetical protein